MRARVGVALVAAAALVLAAYSSFHSTSHNYLVPRSDQQVLDHTYLRMLDAQETGADEHAGPPDGATAGQRMLYRMFLVDDEIANGGLYQVYWNLRGSLIEEAIHDADGIGAHHWASLVRQAGQKLFPRGVPNDDDARREALGCPDYCDKGSVDSLADHWRQGELRRPLLRYVRAHPAEFFSNS